MQYVKLGRTGLDVSRICLGCMSYGDASRGGHQWVLGEEDARTFVKRALELGVNFFDTANVYSVGSSEEILGRALGDDRSSVVVATKLFPVLPGSRVVGHRAVASARRLGLSCLDVYQVHWPNPFISDGTLMRGMRRIQEAGLIDEVGVSAYSQERWQSAEDALGGRVLTNQVSYSLVERAPERDVLPFAEATGHAVIAFSPLGQGLLSGRYDHDNPRANFRATDLPVAPPHRERVTDLLTTLTAAAPARSACGAYN